MEWIDERNLWELTILEGNALNSRMSSVAAGDIDGDGRVEIVAAGDGLVWYRPETRERGVIVEPGSTFIHGGMKLADIDGDGILEVISGESPTMADSQGGGKSLLVWFKPQKDLRQPWERFVIEPDYPGYAHDLMLADLDGSGDRKIVAISVYSSVLGLYVYQRNGDARQPWTANTVSEGYFADGTCVGDVDGDGIMEIVCGPDLYKAPPGGVMAGRWHRSVYAPDFRDMCLTALVDITHTGRPDIVVAEAEYLNGRLSWFENRTLEDPSHPWAEHFLQDGMAYAHSMFAGDGTKKGASFAVGEMERGGWYAPYNHDARIIGFSTEDRGNTWTQRLVSKGEGTHQAIRFDIDGDGESEIIGESNGQYLHNPRVQVWKRKAGATPHIDFRHRFIDREKPAEGTFLLTGDIDGDGMEDIVCGRWWYRYPEYERRELPGVAQAVCLYDVDGDGRLECVAEMQHTDSADERAALCWLKPADALNGTWEAHEIGRCAGTGVAGALAAALLSGGRAALAVSFHGDGERGQPCPELFTIPADLRESPWAMAALADIAWSGQMEACDVDGDGRLDIVAGPWWLKNRGDGTFKPYRFAPEGFEAAGLAIADINGDGRPDIILGEHRLDAGAKFAPWSRVLWFENPADPERTPWEAHGVDSLRCVHSVGACDIDGDGQPEIVCGEHDPYWPYRNRCRLVVYQKTDAEGIAWSKQVVDERFEHYNGARAVRMPAGNVGILSHGRSDTKYVSLWEPAKE